MLRNLNQHIIGKLVIQVLFLFLFWVLVFDFERIIFTIHNFSKFQDVAFSSWLGTFFYSLRLDLATAGFLSLFPAVFLIISLIWNQKWSFKLFFIILILEAIVCSLIHAGEVNAYPEWNHKLTGRVFMHLSHPDEVARTADWGMTIWFVIYATIESVFAFFLARRLFKFQKQDKQQPRYLLRGLFTIFALPVVLVIFLIFARGGFQPIPINTDAAMFSDNYVANDLSINSTYFFGKSYLLFKRANIDQFIPKISDELAKKTMNSMHSDTLEHNQFVFKTKRPNLVFIILESWTGNAMACLTNTQTATPHFDSLTKTGLFFSNIYAVSGTSEIGNAAIFSAYPAIPEISITMQADKHRKIPCLNQDLEKWGYSSAFLFSGDLKYGNIGGYFTDHGFDVVEDENDFPENLKRGKLNYYDEDLYNLVLQKLAKSKEPFLQCAFTGSTHSPYDFPNPEKFEVFSGVEGMFHNSMLYADSCLNDFIQKAKLQKWYENTIFVFVSDHGHASNEVQNPSIAAYNRIPVLFYGEPLKEEYRGKRIDKLGSQIDIVRTLLYQMGGDYKRYRWSKDLLNPDAPEFALHTINRGYGWVKPNGNFTYQMENKKLIENTFNQADFQKEFKNCRALMSLIYEDYKQL